MDCHLDAPLGFCRGRPRFRIWPTSWSNFGRTHFHGCLWLLYLASTPVADIAKILSCLYYNLNGQKLLSNTLSTQLPNVLSNFTYQFVLIWQLSTNFEQSIVYILKIIGAETQAELEVKGYQNICVVQGFNQLINI